MGKSWKHTILLNLMNIIYMICGGFMTWCGYYLFIDTKRILLSRLLVATSDRLNDLPQPLFYYIALSLIIAGVVAVSASVIGIWASCLSTYCCLSIYFLIVVVLLLAESIVCLAITIWPHCLGISLDETKMVKVLQSFYGVPGKEQFTIAMDLAQSRFGCCGINDQMNFENSLWKTQEYGQKNWVVPLSCCVLENPADEISYLDPKPANETRCQSLLLDEFYKARYTEPCLKFLQDWYREHYTLFLTASSVVAIVEFIVLLTIVFSCTNQSKDEIKVIDFTGKIRAKPRKILVENVYETALFEQEVADKEYNQRGVQLETNFKDIYTPSIGIYQQRRNSTFKPLSKDFANSKSNYLS